MLTSDIRMYSVIWRGAVVLNVLHTATYTYVHVVFVKNEGIFLEWV